MKPELPPETEQGKYKTKMVNIDRCKFFNFVYYRGMFISVELVRIQHQKLLGAGSSVLAPSCFTHFHFESITEPLAKKENQVKIGHIAPQNHIIRNENWILSSLIG